MKLADLFSVTSSFKLYETEKMYSGSLPRRTVDPDKALLMDHYWPASNFVLEASKSY